MKKKILVILMLFMLPLCLLFGGCNKQIFDFNYTFNRAYVKIGNEWKDLAIRSWKDYAGEQLQLVLTDGTVMIVCSVNCILYNGTLQQE